MEALSLTKFVMDAELFTGREVISLNIMSLIEFGCPLLQEGNVVLLELDALT